MASTSKRERELARLRAQRQAARRAAQEVERVKRRNAILAGLSAIAVAAVIVVIALVTDDGGSSNTLGAEPTPSATASASPSASPLPPGSCGYTASAQPASKKVSGQPPVKPTNKGDVKVVMTTNRGEIDMTFNGAKAPCTTGSFVFLANQKYFDGTSCHRLTTAGIFVLQCGDPSGSGSGGPGYQFADENLDGLGAAGADGSVTYPRGTVAMANAGPGTNGSQFFLVYKDSKLPPNYTPFGRITKGLEILDAVAKAGTSTPTGDGKPKLGVTITTFRVSA